MKKTGLRKIWNFILCISLLASVFSTTVMAENETLSVTALSDTALDDTKATATPETVGSPITKAYETPIVSPYDLPTVSPGEVPTATPAEEEGAQEQIPTATPDGETETAQDQVPASTPDGEPEATPDQTPTATPDGEPTFSPIPSPTAGQKDEAGEEEVIRAELIAFLKETDVYKDQSEEELLDWIAEMKETLSMETDSELLECLEQIRDEIYAEFREKEDLTPEEMEQLLAEEFAKRLNKLLEDVSEESEGTTLEVMEEEYLLKIKELLGSMEEYEQIEEEKLQELIDELVLKGEFETYKAFYEFIEEESVSKELFDKISEGVITKDFRSIAEIVRMIGEYADAGIVEIRELIDQILLRYEITDADVRLAFEEELSCLLQEMEELENYDEMTEEEKRLYLSQALGQMLDMLLHEELMLLDVSGSVNLNPFNNGGTLTLSGDATANNICQLSGTLTIDLKGHDLTMANGAQFMMNSEKAVLNIKDSVGGGTIYACCQLVWGYNGGTINLYSGTLDGSRVTSKGQQGGCINLGRSNMGNHTFNMYGGTIQNFEATQYGGAVFVGSMFSSRKNTFNMYGGTIKDCYAPLGSGVYVDDSGDGPGYFYIKGGTKQSEGGEPKATIRCLDGPNAIYNYGYLGMEGVVDIDGIVYLNQNNWASTYKHFIKITGRLVVIGDGYIDIDSAYPNSNAVCPGHTVVENATQTEGVGSVTISQEEFYTYSSYFINTTKGLMVSAGYDPSKNTSDGTSSQAPANWPSYQGDKFSQKYSYIDVMGQELLIQSSDSPGEKRAMQNYNYLIYVERANPVEPYKQYYSIKLIKTDIDGENRLDQAEFQLVQTHDADGNELEAVQILGSSASTGDESLGLDNGVTYLYLSGKDGKLMIEDGIYELRETQAPGEGYVLREHVVTLHIYHKIDSSTGQEVSVVEVRANGKILSTTEQEINSSFHDKGYLVEREIVLNINNAKYEIVEKTDYKISVEKYADAEYQTPLAGASFALQTTAETSETKATGNTGEDGKAKMLDQNGSEFTFSNEEHFLFKETAPPEEYFSMEDVIDIKVNEDGQVLINDVALAEGASISSAADAEVPEHGSWKVTLQEDTLTFQVYDEKMPPTWTMKGTKYGTKEIDALRLSGVQFTLFKIETVDGVAQETPITSVTSSDGTDGYAMGELAFVDEEGNPLELSCNSTYLLKETYAPMGYTRIGDLKITVDETCSEIGVTKHDDVTGLDIHYTGASYDAENRVLTLSIVDETVYQMPNTGGEGIYPLLLCSIGLMYVSALCWILLSGKNRFYREE